MTRKVRPGQVIRKPSSSDENAKAAAADAYRRGPDETPERQQPIITDVIMVKNNSASNFRRGDVLGLESTALLTQVDRGHVWISANKLTALSRNCICAVLLNPLDAGKIGAAQIGGAGIAYVTVGATWHRRAYPVASADVLASGLFGPLEILITPAGTGERLCFVRIGHADNRGVFAKTTSSITAAVLTSGRLTLGSGTAKVYDPYTTTAGQYSDPTHEATVYNMAGGAVDTAGYVYLTPTDDWLPLVNIDPCTQPA